MKLKVHKENREDPEFVDVADILSKAITKHQDISHLVSQDELLSILRDVLLEMLQHENLINVFAESGIFNLALPVNIGSSNAVENSECMEGTMYYDFINKRFRGKTNKGWITLSE